MHALSSLDDKMILCYTMDVAGRSRLWEWEYHMPTAQEMEETEAYTGGLNGMEVTADGARVILTGTTYVRYEIPKVTVFYVGTVRNINNTSVILVTEGETWRIIGMA